MICGPQTASGEQLLADFSRAKYAVLYLHFASCPLADLSQPYSPLSGIDATLRGTPLVYCLVSEKRAVTPGS